MPEAEADSEIVGRAIAREAELRAEIEGLNAKIEDRNKELKELEVFLSVFRKLADKPAKGNEATSAQSSPASSNGDGKRPKSAFKTSPPGMRQGDFTAFVRSMLLEHGRPMEPRKILDGIKRKGRHIGGEKEYANLKAKLFRAKQEIVHISGSGYWPIDISCPEVSYTPP